MPRTAYPSDADALTEALHDPEYVREHFSDPEAATRYIVGVATEMARNDPELQEQLREEIAAESRRFAEDNGFTEGRPPTVEEAADYDPVAEAMAIAEAAAARSTPFGRSYNPRALGAQLDEVFRLSDPEARSRYFQSIWHRSDSIATPQLRADRDRVETVTAAYSSQIGADGGFLIPEEMRATLLSVALERAIVRPRATVLPMSSGKLSIPAIDATSNVSSVFGGVVCYWTEDGASMTETSAQFQTIDLEPKTLTGYTEVNNTTLMDTLAFGAYFDQTFPRAIAYFEDDAFLVGNGVGKPLGALNAGGVIEVAKEGGQAADTIQWENIVKMFARMLPQSLPNSVWVVSPDTFPELATMTFSSTPVMIGEGRGPDAPYGTILGRPVLISEKVPALGDAGDISLIDFSFYLIGDRQTMTADSSPHRKFEQNKTVFRIVERVDGRPWLQTALTPRNNSATLSAYVKLAERA